VYFGLYACLSIIINTMRIFLFLGQSEWVYNHMKQLALLILRRIKSGLNSKLWHYFTNYFTNTDTIHICLRIFKDLLSFNGKLSKIVVQMFVSLLGQCDYQ